MRVTTTAIPMIIPSEIPGYENTEDIVMPRQLSDDGGALTALKSTTNTINRQTILVRITTFTTWTD